MEEVYTPGRLEANFATTVAKKSRVRQLHSYTQMHSKSKILSSSFI